MQRAKKRLIHIIKKDSYTEKHDQSALQATVLLQQCCQSSHQSASDHIRTAVSMSRPPTTTVWGAQQPGN